MATNYIYAISVTKFNNEGEIVLYYISHALYTTIEKACKDLEDTTKCSAYSNVHVEFANTEEMTIWYTDEKGRRTIEGIERRLLF